MGAIIPVFAGCVLGAFYTCICCLYSGWYLRLYWLAVFVGAGAVPAAATNGGGRHSSGGQVLNQEVPQRQLPPLPFFRRQGAHLPADQGRAAHATFRRQGLQSGGQGRVDGPVQPLRRGPRAS